MNAAAAIGGWALCVAICAGTALGQTDLKVKNKGVIVDNVAINNAMLRMDAVTITEQSGNFLSWAADPTGMGESRSAVITNPVYNSGNSGNNPLYGAPQLRIEVTGATASYVWDDKGGMKVDFVAFFNLADAADPLLMPIYSAKVKGDGIKFPDPPSGDDIIVGDYKIAFSPDAPFTFADGSTPDEEYAISIAEGSTWDLQITPVPGPCVLAVLVGIVPIPGRRRGRTVAYA